MTIESRCPPIEDCLKESAGTFDRARAGKLSTVNIYAYLIRPGSLHW